jgi:hypothetical protein
MRTGVILAMHDVDCALEIGCRRAGELDLAIIDRSDRHRGHLAERSKSVAAICRAHEHVQ